jgi:hypothetical protein
MPGLQCGSFAVRPGQPIPARRAQGRDGMRSSKSIPPFLSIKATRGIPRGRPIFHMSKNSPCLYRCDCDKTDKMIVE